MHEAGDVILTNIQFADTFEIKTRPALVLFEDHNNIVVAGITSNTKMEGIPLTKCEGAIKESIIKINYIFTVSEAMVKKKLFQLSAKKKAIVFKELTKKLACLCEN
jgi:mRNA interferase MazF